MLESVAMRQLAAARFLPSINPGMNYDTHTGNFQQSNGNILSVNRGASMSAAGSMAIAPARWPFRAFIGSQAGRYALHLPGEPAVVRQREFDEWRSATRCS